MKMNKNDRIAAAVEVASWITSCPEDAELLRDVLCANYMWSASGDGTLAIDEESGLLVVHRMMELPMPPASFIDEFSSLVGAARYWRTRLEPATGTVELLESNGMLRV